MKKRAPRSRPKYDPSSRPDGAVRPDLPRPVVLVVDIDPTHRRIVRILLEVAVGARVLEAESSDQALSLARVFNPDLLISNLVNPRTKDGLEFVKTFRVRNPFVPVIVVSGSVDAGIGGCAHGFGTPACASRMMVWSDLLETVRRALSGDDARRVSRRLARRKGAWIQMAERCLSGRWGDSGGTKCR